MFQMLTLVVGPDQSTRTPVLLMLDVAYPLSLTYCSLIVLP